MSTTVTGSVKVASTFTRADDTNPLGTVKDGPTTIDYSRAFAAGSGDNQINKKWSKRITLVSATPEDLDLTALAEDVFGDGATIGFTTVRLIQIINNGSADTAIVSVGGGSNPFIPWLLATGDGVKIGPDGCFLLCARKKGYAVTGGTGDILRLVQSSGADVTVDVVIEGVG